MKFLSLLLVLAIGTVLAEEKANLLVQKSLLNKELVRGEPIEVQIRVFNTGADDAFDVTVDDSASWSEDGFSFEADDLTPTWERISAGSNVNVTYSVTPAETQAFTTSRPATVTYKTEKGGDEVESVSTNFDNYLITSAEEHRRLTDQHLDEWAVFVVLAAIPVGLPFLVTTFINMNYEDGLPRKAHSA